MDTMNNGGKVYLRSFGVCAGLALANMVMYRLLSPLLKPSIEDGTLRWAIVVCLMQVAAIVSGGLYLVARRAGQQYRENLAEQIRPAIQERVMSFALAGEAWQTPVPARGPARRVLEQCIAHALVGLKDSARDRLANFACEQGFARQWEKEFLAGTLQERKRAVSLLGLLGRGAYSGLLEAALRDKDSEIRTEATRAVLAAGDPQDIDRVFRSVLKEPMLIRALLTSDLKRHARYLLAQTIPSILEENTHADTKNCLEILTVWKLANPGLPIAALLERHRDESVLPLVVELLPYASVEDSIEESLHSALDDKSLEVQCAAARATGQMKLKPLIPALVRSLHQNRRLALASATALAQMGAQGARHLETIVRGSDRKAAAVAMEALEALAVAA